MEKGSDKTQCFFDFSLLCMITLQALSIVIIKQNH